jgi:hypothetical protein
MANKVELEVKHFVGHRLAHIEFFVILLAITDGQLSKAIDRPGGTPLFGTSGTGRPGGPECLD